MELKPFQHLTIVMLKRFFLWVLFFAGFGVNAQVLSVKVIDNKSGESIPNASLTITVKDDKKDTVFIGNSQINGTKNFHFNSFEQGKMNLNVLCSHPLYEGFQKNYQLNHLDTVKITILMNPVKIRDIKEVVVKAPGVPDTVFQSDRLSVADFEIQNNGNILLLAYPKQLNKGSELLLFDGNAILTSFQVNDRAQYLVRDYLGNSHVVCDENTFGIYYDGRDIQVAQIPKDYFFKYLAPIVDTTASKLYFSNFNKDYPAFNYFAMDKADSTYKTILHIEDDFMMELYRSEYKWMDVRTKLWAKNKEIETGIDKEIWVGANFFTQSIYYKEVYAPMFQRNDSVFVFNYPKDKLEVFDANGNKIDSMAIFHHYHAKQTGWKGQLIQDHGTGAIYAIYERTGNTFLGLVDVKTGHIQEKVKLNFRYVDKIRIHNNFVYYVYRPFESIQKKFLYKERLPYNFELQNVYQGTAISIDTGK